MVVKDNMINAKTIAKYFLTKSELTPKKLQKLVYYSYSWFIALNNENADDISAVGLCAVGNSDFIGGNVRTEALVIL